MIRPNERGRDSSAHRPRLLGGGRFTKVGKASSLSVERTPRAFNSVPAALGSSDIIMLALARSVDRLEACPTSLA
jgi:hypothetical protein